MDCGGPSEDTGIDDKTAFLYGTFVLQRDAQAELLEQDYLRDSQSYEERNSMRSRYIELTQRMLSGVSSTMWLKEWTELTQDMSADELHQWYRTAKSQMRHEVEFG